MLIKLQAYGKAIRIAMLSGAVTGAIAGVISRLEAQGGFPHQCWNNGGPNLCEFCGTGCMGDDYICCHQ